jgi:S1-C subfamily serine protease
MKRAIAGCLLGVVLGAFVTVGLIGQQSPWSTVQLAGAQGLADGPDIMLAPGQPALPGSLTPEELTNIRVYELANRSVVNINTQVVTYERFFMLPIPGQGTGSGSVLDKQGHILTNYHVVEDAREIQVTLPGGKTYPAEIIGHDKELDIAVLKIDAPPSDLYPITLGTSDALRVGQRVYALGNPFGFEGTLTTGIISNLNRTLPSRVDDREMRSIIQTDAALNPGNSGGPLLDTGGRMIGMNLAIATKTGQNSGLGFAIPINRIRPYLPDLVQRGRVVRADVGIVAVMETDRGLQIVRLNEGGPAEQAGLRGWRTVERQVTRGPLVYTIKRDDRSQADLIVAVDGQQVASASAFIETIEQHRPGDRITLTILRDGRQTQVPVTLGGA